MKLSQVFQVFVVPKGQGVSIASGMAGNPPETTSAQAVQQAASLAGVIRN
jgi:hypothetical protein